jgi:ubiquinone/menaquinone biosynthesis C-methylase UbiE
MTFDKDYFENLYKENKTWNYGNGFEQRKFKAILSMIPDKNYDDVLDIGCSTGILTQKLYNLKIKNLTGIDISETAINKASDFKPIKFEIGSLPSLKYNDDSFDLVVCSDVLWYFDKVNIEKSLIEIKRILKEDGYILIVIATEPVNDYEPYKVVFELFPRYFDILKIIKLIRLRKIIKGKLTDRFIILGRKDIHYHMHQ